MSDYLYIDTTGVIIPDTGDLLTGVQDEYKEALGNNLIVTPETPQGVLITAETVARDAVVRNNAALGNQINPNLAGGVFLDAICALTGLERARGSRSIISDVLLTGVPSTIIPSGVQAQTILGDIFESINSVVLDVTGNAVVDFQALEIGAVGAPAASLNQIVTGVLGWENVTNPNAAVLGASEQTDQALREKRRLTLALQGVAISEAIISALYDVPEVRSLKFRENVTNITKLIDGISLLPHSIYVCIDGGVDTDIAMALLDNKSCGANWNGSTTINVIDPASGQSYPVKFSRPNEIPILIKVTVQADSSFLDPITAVKKAIVDYANGNIDGEAGFVVGGPVSAFELAGAINIQAPGIYVTKIQTTKVSIGVFSSDEIPIEINEVARIIESNIQVIIL